MYRIKCLIYSDNTQYFSELAVNKTLHAQKEIRSKTDQLSPMLNMNFIFRIETKFSHCILYKIYYL